MGFIYMCAATISLEKDESYYFIPRDEGYRFIVERCTCYSDTGFSCKQNGIIVVHDRGTKECRFKHGEATFIATAGKTVIEVLCEGNILR